MGENCQCGYLVASNPGNLTGNPASRVIPDSGTNYKGEKTYTEPGIGRIYEVDPSKDQRFSNMGQTSGALTAQGIWDRLHLVLLIQLRQHDQIDWSRASIDGASVASPRGAKRPVPTPPIEANAAASGTSS